MMVPSLRGLLMVCVYSHLWCVEKKIWLSLVLMLDLGDAVVCFLVAVLI